MDADAKYYCPYCAQVLGILTYYPELKEKLDISFIDFERPRKVIVDLVGEENQGCPNLILEKKEFKGLEKLDYINEHGDYYFINKALLITRFFSDIYGIGVPH
ncbi:hypothetical protein Musp01_23950 [Muricauda sp. NBRC 101325]|nr:hypothetical protein Musp01_23950 [Muricauda sp. NBRC 101325]